MAIIFNRLPFFTYFLLGLTISHENRLYPKYTFFCAFNSQVNFSSSWYCELLQGGMRCQSVQSICQLLKCSLFFRTYFSVWLIVWGHERFLDTRAFVFTQWSYEQRLNRLYMLQLRYKALLGLFSKGRPCIRIGWVPWGHRTIWMTITRYWTAFGCISAKKMSINNHK